MSIPSQPSQPNEPFNIVEINGFLNEFKQKDATKESVEQLAQKILNCNNLSKADPQLLIKTKKRLQDYISSQQKSKNGGDVLDAKNLVKKVNNALQSLIIISTKKNKPSDSITTSSITSNGMIFSEGMMDQSAHLRKLLMEIFNLDSKVELAQQPNIDQKKGEPSSVGFEHLPPELKDQMTKDLDFSQLLSLSMISNTIFNLRKELFLSALKNPEKPISFLQAMWLVEICPELKDEVKSLSIEPHIFTFELDYDATKLMLDFVSSNFPNLERLNCKFDFTAEEVSFEDFKKLTDLNIKIDSNIIITKLPDSLKSLKINSESSAVIDREVNLRADIKNLSLIEMKKAYPKPLLPHDEKIHVFVGEKIVDNMLHHDLLMSYVGLDLFKLYLDPEVKQVRLYLEGEYNDKKLNSLKDVLKKSIYPNTSVELRYMQQGLQKSITIEKKA